MPKLLQINVTSNWGSIGKIAEQIGQCAMRHGWESYVAYGRMQNPSKNKLIKIGTMADVYRHYATQRLLDNEGLCSSRATRRFLKTVDEIKPDIVHLHNIHDHYLNYRLLFSYLAERQIPVVWTFHDCWAFTGHCFHFVTKNCERWKTECHDCPLGHEYPNTLLDRSRQNFQLKKKLFSNHPNLTIVACSDWIRDFAAQSFLKQNRIEVIKNGIDLDTFKPYGNKSSEKFRIIAVSSVWNKQKGLDDIKELRKLLDDDHEIIVVGVTKSQKQDLPNGIIGIERTNNVQELAGLYSSSNVLINPTYADTFPTVNLEALACGTPVITYRTGGSPEAIDDKTGIVVEQGDVNAMALAIAKLKQHPLSAADCRARAEAHFNRNTCFEKYIQLYNDILK